MSRIDKYCLIISITLILIELIIHLQFKDVSKDVAELQQRHKILKQELTYLKNFEDSVVYGNSSYKKKVLDTIKTVAEFNELLHDKQQEFDKKGKEIKKFTADKKKVDKQFRVLSGLGDLTMGILVVVILFWVISTSYRRTTNN